MNRIACWMMIICLGFSATIWGVGKNPVLEVKTTAGTIIVELYPDKAPLSVKNFLTYVQSGFYKGTIFHRVIPGFMVQGGGFDPGLVQKKSLAPIKNEATNGLENKRGTLAMARTGVVNSATSQFFINVADNKFLNYSSDRDYGYAVFGAVINGMDIVDAIVSVPSKTDGYYENVPVDDIIINSVQLLNPPKISTASVTGSVKVK